MPTITRPAVALPDLEVSETDVLDHLGRKFAELPRLDHVMRVAEACQVRTRYHARAMADLDAASPEQRMLWHMDDVCGLSERAARQALDASGVSVDEVTSLMTVGAVGYHMPGPDVHLIERLGLRPTVRRLPIVNMGCGGGPYALYRAWEQAVLDPGATVLVICIDAFVPFLHPDDTGLDVMIFRALLGDGAAACLVRGGTDGPGPQLSSMWNYTAPGTAEIVGFRLDNAGMHAFNSPRIVQAVKNAMPELVRWLEAPPEFVVAHPGSPRILQAATNGLGVDQKLFDKSWESLQCRGNMGSASMMDVLARTVDDPPALGSRGLLLGAAPGVTIIACPAIWQ